MLFLNTVSLFLFLKIQTNILLIFVINGKISRLKNLILSFLQQITIHYVLPRLSLRGGGRGFPPATTMNMAPRYFHYCYLQYKTTLAYMLTLPGTGHQISWIKSSYELFCVLICNLSHFLPKFEFSLILSSFSGAFLHVFHH